MKLRSAKGYQISRYGKYVNVYMPNENHPIQTQFGHRDDIEIFRIVGTKNEYLILSENCNLGYASLAYIADNRIAMEAFIQNTDELELPKDYSEYSATNRAKILNEYLN
jgi:hypothetical protein